MLFLVFCLHYLQYFSSLVLLKKLFGVRIFLGFFFHFERLKKVPFSVESVGCHVHAQLCGAAGCCGPG